ncbi:P-loop NTPase [Microbacterium sp. MEC084]|uniref:AAA family ATPase n=1 Tax=Microbacterium sp. MEC084 TaxID=1963027 RepID=UPI00106F9BC0|nr:P-loop NTPase [Microbacterium sp. MEC084]MCD1268947.1 P-loop NTPase [Microbacterium sp. MEC084]
MIALVAADDGERIAEELRDEGVIVPAVLEPGALAAAGSRRSGPSDLLQGVDALVLSADRGELTAALVSACDRLGVRIVLLAERPGDLRAARAFGLAEPLPPDAPGWRIAAAAGEAGLPSPGVESGDREPRGGRIIAVWGPEGAPGRTTIAIELACAMARAGRHVALVDADGRAPSVAVVLGLADESPGFAAACRQAEHGLLDAGELLRVSVPLGDPDGRVDVLTGINRVSRWPELSAPRVAAALAVIREWADVVVVDVGASLEADEEIVSDLDGPRRNAATLATLRAADEIVAVAAADPVGLSRFVRGHSELRQIVGQTPVRVVVNRLRPGPLGLDPRGQVRRALERFSGIADVAFVPDDRRAADAALLAARPASEVSPRSALAQAVRRLAAGMQPAARRLEPVTSRTRGGVLRRGASRARASAGPGGDQ